MPIIEVVGGAYSMLECNCGAKFCCGEIARRVMSNNTLDYDPYFLLPGLLDPDMLRINLLFLRKANERYAERKPSDRGIKQMCVYINGGAAPTVGADTITNCSRHLNIDSCCVNMNVKSAF